MDRHFLEPTDLLAKLRAVALAEDWNQRRLTNTLASVRAIYRDVGPDDAIDISRSAVEKAIDSFLATGRQGGEWSEATRRAYASHWRTASQVLRDFLGERSTEDESEGVPDVMRLWRFEPMKRAPRKVLDYERTAEVARVLQSELRKPVVAQGQIGVVGDLVLRVDLVVGSTAYFIDPPLGSGPGLAAVLGRAVMLKRAHFGIVLVVGREVPEDVERILREQNIGVKVIPHS